MLTKDISNPSRIGENAVFISGKSNRNQDNESFQKIFYQQKNNINQSLSLPKSGCDFSQIPSCSQQFGENRKDKFSNIVGFNNRSLISASEFDLKHNSLYNYVNQGKKKISVDENSNSINQSGAIAHAISASGAGTVATTYTPEATDKSNKIVFIQVMRELLDGVPIKPSVAAPSFAYQDADTTADLYHVDYVSGEKDPYYNGDDPQDFGPQGNAVATPRIAASTSDTPNYTDGSFPAGKTKLAWEFSTAAFSAAGSDAGTYYGSVDWAYAKEKGKAGTTAIGATRASPGVKFEDAVKLWNSNHGFNMPGKGSNAILGGILGGVLGGAAGAGLGFAVGGPIGALAGGLIGLGVGAVVGALAGSK